MLDPSTMVLAKQYERLVPEYTKRGIQVITIPFEISIRWGVGTRCSVGPLHREEVK